MNVFVLPLLRNPQTAPVIDPSLAVNSFLPEAVISNRSFARVMPRRRCAMPGRLLEEFHILGGLGFRGFDLAKTDEEHGAEQKALAALHGQDVGMKCRVIGGKNGKSDQSLWKALRKSFAVCSKRW